MTKKKMLVEPDGPLFSLIFFQRYIEERQKRFEENDTDWSRAGRPNFQLVISLQQNGCWLSVSHKPNTSRSSRTGIGYSVVSLYGETRRLAQVIWEEFNGPFPEDMAVLHTCDNSWCCNPEHVYPGTLKQNMLDRLERSPESYQVRSPRLKVWQVIAIRSSSKTGSELSREFNTSEAVISLVKTGKCYSKNAYDDDGHRAPLPKAFHKEFVQKQTKRGCR